MENITEIVFNGKKSLDWKKKEFWKAVKIGGLIAFFVCGIFSIYPFLYSYLREPSNIIYLVVLLVLFSLAGLVCLIVGTIQEGVYTQGTKKSLKKPKETEEKTKDKNRSIEKKVKRSSFGFKLSSLKTKNKYYVIKSLLSFIKLPDFKKRRKATSVPGIIGGETEMQSSPEDVGEVSQEVQVSSEGSPEAPGDSFFEEILPESGEGPGLPDSDLPDQDFDAEVAQAIENSGQNGGTDEPLKLAPEETDEGQVKGEKGGEVEADDRPS